MTYKVAYLILLSAAGALLAGLLSLALTRGLARAGALNALPPGQEARESRTVG